MDYNARTDFELVTLLKQGNKAAFAVLYIRYVDLLLLHAQRMLGDSDEAKDVVQETFAEIWAKKESIRIPSAVNAYLYASIRNRILNYMAHQKVIAKYTNSLDAYLESEVLAADDRLMEQELIEIIQNEILLLPEKMRKVFELSRNEALSHKKIAEQLNISDKTVKKQISRALKILRYKINFFCAFFW